MCAPISRNVSSHAIAGDAAANRINLGGKRKDFFADVLRDEPFAERLAADP